MFDKGKERDARAQTHQVVIEHTVSKQIYEECFKKEYKSMKIDFNRRSEWFFTQSGMAELFALLRLIVLILFDF